MAFLESLLSLLAAFGLVCLLWLGAGWLLLPLRCPARVVLEGHGTGEYLEQAVRALPGCGGGRWSSGTTAWMPKGGCWPAP